MALRPLSAYKVAPYRPRVLAITGLVAVAVLYVVSMPMQWVGVVDETGHYLHVTGLAMANWVIVAAVIVAAIAIRLVFAPPGGFLKFLLVFLDFYICIGLYIEYIDNVGRAEADQFTPYIGPGFLVTLAATALLIVSTVLAWREHDNWIEDREAPTGPEGGESSHS